MKIFLMSCMMFLGLSAAWAAPQYTIAKDGIIVNENMSLTIHVSGNSLFKNYDQFGFVIRNADGTSRTQLFSVAEASSAGKQFDFGDFTAGDKIKFILAKGGQTFDNFDLTRKNDELTRLGFYRDSGGLEAEIQIHLAGGASHSNNPPSGQPLPGVLAALLLGGGVLGAGRTVGRRKA